MNLITKLTTILTLSLICLSHSMSVQAQEIIAVDSPVYEQESLSKDIRQLKIQYRGELEEYRTAEKEYLIAKDQYQKLNTLASLEDAVQKTQATMLLRDKVLRTYLRLLRLTLLSQPGIEIPAKKEAEQSLLAAITKIESHQKKFDKVLDKPQLQTIATDYESLFTEVKDASFQTLSLLSIGELQTIHDKSIALKDDMKTEIATVGGVLKTTERKRSFDEIDRVIAKLKPEFDEVEVQYTKLNSSGYENIYSRLQKPLGSIHSSLSQILTYLGELLKT